MPLVKLFARNNLTKAVPLARLQKKICEIWETQPSTTKMMLFRCEDWTDESFQEDIYVDIRAYGTFKHILPVDEDATSRRDAGTFNAETPLGFSDNSKMPRSSVFVTFVCYHVMVHSLALLNCSH
jgi:hypothetical protein